MGGKTILEFYPFDIDYIADKTATIRLFGYTKEGKSVVVLDDSFIPYFYVIINPKKKEKAVEFIKNIEVKTEERTIKPLGIHVFEKKLIGNPVTALRVDVQLPTDISILKEYIKETPGYLDRVEIDVSFYKRYLIDKKFQMLTRLRCNGEIIEDKKYKADYVVLADSIEEAEGEVYENPRILAFDIETYNPIGNPRPSKDPVLMISIATNYGFEKVITWKRFENSKKYVEFVESELDLLKRFSEIIEKENPQIIVGYNSDNFDFPYLHERAKKYKLSFNWGIDRSKLRLSRRGINKVAKIKGVPHIDIYTFIKNILSPTLKTEVYDLNSVASELLGEEKLDGVDWTNIAKFWDVGGENLSKVVDYSMKDSILTIKLMNKLFPLISELTRIVGQSIFDVSRMTYGQCVEWFLAKNAASFNELIPPKPIGSYVSTRINKTYEGAYVHEPKPGIFENIVVYDFRSLYPSIIVSHNICPTTIFCDCCKDGYKTPPIGGKSFSFCKKHKGFVPSLLDDLINRRMRIKEILKKIHKDDVDYTILSARSYAIKTIANAIYGYFGFARSRWYCLECAASITAWGRYYIKNVIEQAKKYGFNVLYADTDSLFISLDNKKLEEAEKFIENINKNLPGVMELEFQGFYTRGIFVAAKKRYALADMNGNLIIKGLEWVRRDWSKIAKDTQMAVLKAILIDGSTEKAVDIIKDTIKRLKDGNISLEEVTIFTQLTRKIENYESIGPHVSAAIKAREKGYTFEPGQMIKYVVVKGEGSISDKSYILEEVKDNKLEYDPEYYINNQVLPAVERIFEVLGVTKDELRGKIQTKLEGFFR